MKVKHINIIEERTTTSVTQTGLKGQKTTDWGVDF